MNWQTDRRTVGRIDAATVQSSAWNSKSPKVGAHACQTYGKHNIHPLTGRPITHLHSDCAPPLMLHSQRFRMRSKHEIYTRRSTLLMNGVILCKTFPFYFSWFFLRLLFISCQSYFCVRFFLSYISQIWRRVYSENELITASLKLWNF